MNPVCTTSTLIQTRQEPVEEYQELRLTIEQRITRFALLVLFVALILPLFFWWPNVKRLWLETYDGIDRSSYFTTEVIDPDVETVLREDSMDNLSICDSIFHSIFRDERAEFDKQIREECISLASEIKDLKSQMSRFDNFVKEHKELLDASLFYLQKFPEFISHAYEIPSTFNREDPIDLRTMLLMEKINLEHLIEERKHFFMRHKKVYIIFLKYIKEMPEEIEYL